MQGSCSAIAVLRVLCIVAFFIFSSCSATPFRENQRGTDFGLADNAKVLNERLKYDVELANNSGNSSYHRQIFINSITDTVVHIRINKADLNLYDDVNSVLLHFELSYQSNVSLVVSYDLDSSTAVSLTNISWYRLPPAVNATFNIPVHARPHLIGLSYIRFWLYEVESENFSDVQSWPYDSSSESNEHFNSSLARLLRNLNATTLGFPILVLRGKGLVQLIFRVLVVSMVTLFTFAMGCDLDPAIMKSYFRRPVGPAIGFACQFVIMPVVAFAIAWFVPIKREFGFGLLTIGCSPGGGASNMWSLMLGGDINLSILMTFISSFAALFMMPLLLFVFGRFFIDVHRVHIPYGNICIQLLQIALPALAGLGLRWWKPNVAKFFKKFTRPLFVVFIIFFLTFGIYANWSIFRLIGSYPIVMPTSALLPWISFCLAALVAFILRQPRAVVITVALETGIQNVGAAILVLLYSMPQPAGDLGAVMPITVSIFTPLPLYLIWIGLVVKRRCCSSSSRRRTASASAISQDGRRRSCEVLEKPPITEKEPADLVDGLLVNGDQTSHM